MPPIRAAVALALLAALSLPPVALAGPTSVPGGQDEASLNARRAAWIEQIHRAAPGTDWRQVERANRLETAFLRESMPRVAGASAWIEKGASNLTGRNFDSAKLSSGEFVVGSANGGVFRGTAGGGAWTPLTDDVGYGVEHVLVAPGSPDRILAASNSQLYVSTNAGASWSVPTGLPEYIWTVARTVQEADAPLTMYALVDGWIWLGSSWDHNWHLLRSTDGGISFTKIHTEPIATRPDLWISRTAAGPLYMAAGNLLKRSVDHGVTWTTVGTLPASSTSARLAASEAGAPMFYCALEVGGAWTLYRSSGGASWTNVAGLSDFYGTLTATITDANQVFYGGIDCHRSLNGGVTWGLVNHWYDYYDDPQTQLHADIFGFRHFLESSLPGQAGPGASAVDEILHIHTDGGTYALNVTSVTPDNITRFGFRNAQYYGTLTSLGDPDVFSAGAQDQGYQVSHPALGTVTPDLTQVISGDYAHLVSSWPDQSRMVWSVYPGFVLLQSGDGGAVDLELSDFPSGQPGFKFLAATCADPDDASSVYVGARRIWHLTRTAPNAFTWTPLAFDFDHGDGDVVGALAWAPSNHDRGIATTYNGRMYWTANRGATWNESAVTGPPSHYFAGSSVVISPANPLVAWAAGSGYSNPGVYKTTDGGATWTAMATGLPSTQVFAIAQESPASPVLYAATQAGPYRWNGATWENLLVTTCCAPLTDYWHVESIPNRGLVRFSTYGRGVWDYATGAVVSAPPASAKLALAVSPNPAGARSRIAFATSRAGIVDAEVFDLTGRRLATLASGWRAAGTHDLSFDLRTSEGRPLESGLYMVRVRTVEGTAVRRLAVAR